MKHIFLIVGILITVLVSVTITNAVSSKDITSQAILEKTDEEIKQDLELLNKYKTYELKDVEAAFISGATEVIAAIERGEELPPLDEKMEVVFHKSEVATSQMNKMSMLDIHLKTARNLKIAPGTSRVSVIIHASDDKVILLSGTADFRGTDTAQ